MFWIVFRTSSDQCFWILFLVLLTVHSNSRRFSDATEVTDSRPIMTPVTWLSFTSSFLFLLLFQSSLCKTPVHNNSNTFCLQPDVPENCHVIFAQPGPYPEGTVAKYNCALGYERIGPEERTCQSDGKWSGKVPICAIDVAQNKPAEQSSGQSTAQNAVLSIPNCALTDSAKSSWWSVDLLGSFNIRAISITLGHLSSELVDIRMDSGNGTMTSCSREVSLLKNSTTIQCSGDSVTSVMVHAESRLHLCSIKVYATNAREFPILQKSLVIDLFFIRFIPLGEVRSIDHCPEGPHCVINELASVLF